MKKTLLVMAMAIALVLSLMSTALANNGNGKGNAPERGNTTETLGFHEDAEELEIVEVRPEVGDPTADNFEEQFLYYFVQFDEVEYSNWLYREVSRLNGNYEFGEGTTDRFWYGVTGPDSDGIQHEVVHDGLVVQYFRTDDGWRSLTADFAENAFGHGLLNDVNGAAPEGVFGDIEWSPSAGPNEGVPIRSTFSTAQNKIVTTNLEAGTTRSIDVTCEIVDGDEVFLGGTNDLDEEVVAYIRGGGDPSFNQWTGSSYGDDCEAQWGGDSNFLDGFVEFGE